ncbi:hypothetical protein [Methylobacterium haplocladii]|uniref:Uncharacterized protein n=1 Tax=Methylobacterium haplocladii TaxID=1176176 RepID=A0A512IVP7_9HYPH|nr:hypothetical protein [Methylobacterium haplocladii]GEP01790.1 hypothetical protein MHA02_41770 [Methylobacterium haplocladii]GJD86278.1 hypothetical protein HPGCJGGD_4183 [Methylobacterium haplocladii]GLS60461.1 hypothetical protein GCM10007887_31400 [Methylobacterium haplocladii]
MTTALLLSALGVIVGMPIVLYGTVRLDERPGRSSWLIVLFGLSLVIAPVAAAVVLHQEATGNDRYVGR